MPNGKVKQEWQKQAVGSFLQGIFQSRQEKQERDRIMAEKEQLYQQGQHDANYKAKINNLWKLTENADPKIQEFAFKQLQQLNAIGETPEQTPMSELALRYHGAPKGVAALDYRFGADYDQQPITITADDPLGKYDPSMVGHTVTIGLKNQMLAKYRGQDFSFKLGSERNKAMGERGQASRYLQDMNVLYDDFARLTGMNVTEALMISVLGDSDMLSNMMQGKEDQRKAFALRIKEFEDYYGKKVRHHFGYTDEDMGDKKTGKSKSTQGTKSARDKAIEWLKTNAPDYPIDEANINAVIQQMGY